jgi:hypothetical protein
MPCNPRFLGSKDQEDHGLRYVSTVNVKIKTKKKKKKKKNPKKPKQPSLPRHKPTKAIFNIRWYVGKNTRFCN